jgi:hypothetical protein
LEIFHTVGRLACNRHGCIDYHDGCAVRAKAGLTIGARRSDMEEKNNKRVIMLALLVVFAVLILIVFLQQARKF